VYLGKFRHAVIRGNTQLACDIYDKFNRLYSICVDRFKQYAIHGELELIKHIDANSENWHNTYNHILRDAVCQNVTTWLGMSGNQAITKTLVYEARHGTLSQFRAIYDSLPEPRLTTHLVSAALTGNFDVAEWLVVSENVPISNRDLSIAIKYDHLQIVKLFVDNGATFSTDNRQMLARWGSMEMLDYALGITQFKSIRLLKMAVVANDNCGIVDVLVKHGVHDGMVPFWDKDDVLSQCVPRHVMRLRELLGGDIHPHFMESAVRSNDIVSICYGLAMGLRVNRAWIGGDHTFLCHTCTEPHMFNTPHG
jgi:hypothetical protein